MEWFKLLHISCAAISFVGFFIRGIWALTNSGLLQKKWVKILPHVVDTILLLSAFVLLYQFHWSVYEQQWLQVKIVAVVIYIGLGMLTLKLRKSKMIRFVAWIMGLMVFMFIVFIAITKPEFI
ncbi:hypothetical protein MNBD_GAMMA07-1831 [hydrothermal vent metagenome]|uniref:Uncharacterized protein n=1 Tax=hydrothermal vent metagenome TaxID=652676 RepID=A0A3B0WTL8_9ZZZZ